MAASGAPRRAIRVMVVDDSAVARRSISRAIEEDDRLELAGVAADGQIALNRLSMFRPDVIVLDLEMPVMDGFETLRRLRANKADIPVIVFSSHSAKGAAQTLEAMELGAAGFALKPSGLGGSATATLRTELLPLVVAVAPESRAEWRPPPPVRPRAAVDVHAVVVAVSTGGPNALAQIVSALPARLAVPVLVVQHMPATFTKILADRLDRQSHVRVVEASDEEKVTPGRVYIAPGGRHMGIARRGSDVVIALNDGPPENSCRPAADVLFRAAAGVYGSHVLGVVLTGMGNDGTRGADELCRAGGAVIVQDPLTAVVGSMPGSVLEAGLADAVVPLDQVAGEIATRVTKGSPR